MDIRTKLILALVSVSLASMALLGAFAYQTASHMMQQMTLRQLAALAESKKDDVASAFEGWKDQVRLIRSRTQLRASVADFTMTRDDAHLTRIRRILEDAARSVDAVECITLYGPDSAMIASFGEREKTPPYVVHNSEDVRFVGSYPRANGHVHVVFQTDLSHEGRAIGGAEVVLNANDVTAVAEDYTGLGDTGETLIFMDEGNGWIRMLHSLRHDPAGAIRRFRRDEATVDMLTALDGIDTVITRGLVDYRGQAVWSGTRLIDGLSWGVIVKIDEVEEEALPDELRSAMLDLGLALSAFAVVGGLLLGIWLARPILSLTEVVRQVREGHRHVRAKADGDDEIAYLARTLNELLDEHESREKDP